MLTEKRKSYLKEWEKNNSDKMKAKRKRWNDKNRKTYNKAYRLENLDKVKKIDRKSYFKRKYGMSLEELEAMWFIQQNRCFICNSEEQLYLDHNHATNEIRKLLCIGCNTSIGLLKENILTIKKLLKYLETQGKSIC